MDKTLIRYLREEQFPDQKTISLKQVCLDIYSSNLIHVNLIDFRSWSVTSDFKKHDFYGLYYLIKELELIVSKEVVE
jgi:hypothetical protein